MLNTQKADTYALGHLLDELQRGSFVIPDFQWEFAWGKNPYLFSSRIDRFTKERDDPEAFFYYRKRPGKSASLPTANSSTPGTRCR